MEGQGSGLVRVKVLPCKPDDLSSVLRACRQTDRRAELTAHSCPGLHVHTVAPKHKNTRF